MIQFFLFLGLFLCLLKNNSNLFAFELFVDFQKFLFKKKSYFWKLFTLKNNLWKLATLHASLSDSLSSVKCFVAVYFMNSGLKNSGLVSHIR